MPRDEAISSDPARLIARQEALARFGLFALQSDDLDAILTSACEQVALGLNVPIAKIAAAMPGSDLMLLKAAVGLPPSAGIPGVTTIPGGDRSAVGYALLVGEPVVSTIDTETRFDPSEVVLKSGVRSSVNVVIWTAEVAFGALEADSLEPDAFGERDVHFLQLYANLVGAAVERQRLSSRAETLARQREVLLKESVHRVKNILSIVHAVAWRTRRDAASLDDFIASFSGRIGALARLQDAMLLQGKETTSLAELVRAEIGATGAREGEHFVVRGPELQCGRNTAEALELLFYELTTNACKYGALNPAAPDGSRIEVTWQTEPDGARPPELEIRWKERGGKPTGVGKSSGFGSSLLREAIPRMLGGTVQITIDQHGVDCVIQLPR
jgi:two-component sensor histidine kinase